MSAATRSHGSEQLANRSAPSPMRHIDERRLENDLAYRFGYVGEFMGFDDNDVKTIHALAEHLAPLVPALVDAVYVKLFRYDATKRHFVPRQSGYDGALPQDVAALQLDHEQIKFRKAHLANYLKKLVTAAYDDKMVGYLDLVGKMHTAKAGSPDIVVPLVQMNALMGFVSDALLATILGLDLDPAMKAKGVRAVNKLLWLQNDLISRHYAA
ncbi:MAG: protoglobin family protein [Gemmataceae bacterium]|nr:protoglobin family protein [Gemmataceae bacterium]